MSCEWSFFLFTLSIPSISLFSLSSSSSTLTRPAHVGRPPPQRRSGRHAPTPTHPTPPARGGARPGPTRRDRRRRRHQAKMRHKVEDRPRQGARLVLVNCVPARLGQPQHLEPALGLGDRQAPVQGALVRKNEQLGARRRDGQQRGGQVEVPPLPVGGRIGDGRAPHPAGPRRVRLLPQHGGKGHAHGGRVAAPPRPRRKVGGRVVRGETGGPPGRDAHHVGGRPAAAAPEDDVDDEEAGQGGAKATRGGGPGGGHAAHGVADEDGGGWRGGRGGRGCACAHDWCGVGKEGGPHGDRVGGLGLGGQVGIVVGAGLAVAAGVVGDDVQGVAELMGEKGRKIEKKRGERTGGAPAPRWPPLSLHIPLIPAPAPAPAPAPPASLSPFCLTLRTISAHDRAVYPAP